MIKARALHSGGANVPYDLKPDSCPICHHSVEARLLDVGNLIGDPNITGTWLEILFQCPRHECARFFIGRYRRRALQGDRAVGDFRLEATTPSLFAEPLILDEIAEVSPAFKKIYSQASAAEAQELDEIAGVGYRKALEFLVKDFCVLEDPGDGEAIRSESLGTCISNRVTDPGVKECAKRAAWLGNDETHYVRRWEDQDIGDLKILIELTMNWIRSSVLTKRYLAEMESPKS